MSLYAILVNNNRLYSAELDDSNSSVSFGSGKKEIIVDGFSSEQVVVKVSHGKISISTKAPFDFKLNDVPVGQLCMLDTSKNIKSFLGIFSKLSGELKFKPPYNSIITVGRSQSNNVVLSRGYVSKEHFVIKSENGVIRIEDLGSSNGTFLNGNKITKARLNSGDVINVFDIQFELHNGEFSILNAGNGSYLSLDNAQEEENRAEHLTLKYHKSPRTRSVLPQDDIVLAPPPAKPQKFKKGRGNFGHLISSGAMIGSSLAMGAVSPALLAARGASLISPIIGITNSSSMNKERKKELEEKTEERREKYGSYIEDQKALIDKVASEQRTIITQENPAPTECLEVLSRLSSNLWERMPSDSDFLKVRGGMGYDDLCVKIKARNNAGNFKMEEDEIEALTEQIIEENRIVDDVPFLLDIKNNQTIGIVGDSKETYCFVQNLIISLTTLHSFEDVKIVGIFEKEDYKIWNSLRWLPHVWDDDRQGRYLAFGRDEADALCESLSEVIKSRKEVVGQGSYSKGTPLPKPYYVFLCGSKEIIEKEEIIHSLLSNDESIGISTLFLFEEMYRMPAECKYFVDLNDGYGACGYGRNEANKRKYFSIDSKIEDQVFDTFARVMFAVELEGLAALSSIPESATFFEGFGVNNAQELNIEARWAKNFAYKSMATPLGLGVGGKPLMLDMHEKKHGPHGLVAGTTGSGKSEMLLSWILSTAVNYSPQDINFIVIDYKGGGLADRVEKLPHFAGKITNIGNNVERYLKLLSSESKRRLTIFSEKGINDIIEYQSLFHKGVLDTPIPILYIVADEFAELKRNKPEFLRELVSIACVGRSVGIRIILATQKPGGIVDDQIASNTNLRLCMKVASVADSKEVIKRPDAARIRQTGRGYIRVGEDIYFDVFQSLWTGAPFVSNNDAEDIIQENQVRIVEMNGYRNKTVAKRNVDKKDEITQLAVVTDEIVSVASRLELELPDSPLLPELPEMIVLEELEDNYDKNWINIPIGKYDMPSCQKQGVQCLNLKEIGHTGIFGAPATGKTTLLKTVVTSLCSNYTPNDVNIYIIDCGGWSMSVFADMPHVGGVVLDCEEEKIFKFETLILSEFESRKKIFMQNAVGSLAAYRESISEDMPAIVIAIDNITAVFDLYPDLEGTFNMISREGATYGIYLVFTANTSTSVKYKIMQNVMGAIAFELTDHSEYSSTVGRLEDCALPPVTGRAFIKNQPPIEFQAAMFISGESEKERVANIKSLVSKLNQEWIGKRPRPIPIMPETVSKQMIQDNYNNPFIVPVGLDWKNIEIAEVNLMQKYLLLITGTIQSGKSKLLFNIADNMVSKFTQTKLFIFDSNSRSLENIQNKAFHYCLSNNDEEVSSGIENLIGLLNDRKQKYKIAKEEGGASFDMQSFIAQNEMICIVIDDLKEFLDEISDSNCATMERICRIAGNLGVIVIAAGRMADINKYNGLFELAKLFVDNQNGISIGTTPAQTAFFNNDLKYNEKDTESGEGNAFLFLQGKCKLIKLME